MASMLLARELPPYGGDTLFANMYLAYESLSEGLKRTLEGLRAVNSLGARRRHAHARGPHQVRRRGRRRRRSSTPSTRWCAPTPRPAARRST